MKIYHCKVQFDNGAVVKIVELIVVAENEFHAARVCEDKLCKHHDESIRSGVFNEIILEEEDAFILGKI